MQKVDALIIGFGKAGKTLGGALAGAGKSVVLVERDAQRYGGTCINVACIPTKSLVHSAAFSKAAGGSFEDKALRYTQAVVTKGELTGRLRGKNYHKLADLPGATVVDGAAEFVDGHHVRVALTDGGVQEIEAAQIFINTGAHAAIPSIPGVDRNGLGGAGLTPGGHVFVSETLMELTSLPRKMVVVGGGYIGMEFASLYANFGAQVTVVQHGTEFLPREDADIAAAVLASLEARGIRVLRGTTTDAIEDAAGSEHATVKVTTPEGPEGLEAQAVLLATGRRPEVEGLNLAAAGVELTERGAIRTDEHLHTTAPDIWAMGDVVGGLQFTYVSLDDFRIVKSQLLGDGSRTTTNRGAVPYSVFLDPPFSRVGLTEAEARAKGFDVLVGSIPAAAIPKAQVLQQPVGLLKAIVDAKTGQVLGAHLFCEESYEIINLIKLAIDAKVPYTQLRDAIYTHPTMTEGLNDLFAAVR